MITSLLNDSQLDECTIVCELIGEGSNVSWSFFAYGMFIDDDCNRFIQEKLGGPTVSEYEKLQAELSDLQMKYNELLAAHQETCKKVKPATETTIFFMY